MRAKWYGVGILAKAKAFILESSNRVTRIRRDLDKAWWLLSEYREMQILVVGAEFVSTFTAVEHRTPLIGAPQLQCVVPHLFPSAFRAGLPNCSFCLDILCCQRLHSRSLRAEQ